MVRIQGVGPAFLTPNCLRPSPNVYFTTPQQPFASLNTLLQPTLPLHNAAQQCPNPSLHCPAHCNPHQLSTTAADPNQASAPQRLQSAAVGGRTNPQYSADCMGAWESGRNGALPTGTVLGWRLHPETQQAGLGRELVERPYTVGGGGGPPPPGPPPPPDQRDHSGKNKIYERENLVGPFLVHKLLGPIPPSPPPPPQGNFGDFLLKRRAIIPKSPRFPLGAVQFQLATSISISPRRGSPPAPHARTGAQGHTKPLHFHILE